MAHQNQILFRPIQRFDFFFFCRSQIALSGSLYVIGIDFNFPILRRLAVCPVAAAAFLSEIDRLSLSLSLSLSLAS
jgi:hypothetical protein